MALINSADEAAAWARRSLPAKNTLTAADARMVEQRFQARLGAIGDTEAAGGPQERSGGVMAAALVAGGTIADFPHVIPDQSAASVGSADAGRSEKATAVAGKRSRQPHRTVIGVWARQFACAIRTIGDSCCDRLAWCAAVCRPTRITSPSHNRARSDAGSATSSWSRFAGSTTASSTAQGTNLLGGAASTSTRFQSRGGSGSRPGATANCPAHATPPPRRRLWTSPQYHPKEPEAATETAIRTTPLSPLSPGYRNSGLRAELCGAQCRSW